MRAVLMVGLLLVGAEFGRADEGKRVRQVLIQPIDSPAIASTTLGDVLGDFSIRYNMVIVIDTAAFKARDRDDVGLTSVAMPPLKGVSLLTTLRLLAGQAGGGVVQLGDQVWVVPREDRFGRMMSQRVDVRCQGQPVGQVLQDLAKRTGAAFEVDPQVEELLKRKVTCDWKQVRLDQAVERLASLAKLEAGVLGECLYVSTADTIRDLRSAEEQDQAR